MTLNNYMNEIDNKCDNTGFINQVQTIKEAFKLIKGDYNEFLKKVTLGEKDKIFVNNLIKMCDELNASCDALIVVSIKKSDEEKKIFIQKYLNKMTTATLNKVLQTFALIFYAISFVVSIILGTLDEFAYM